MDKMYPHVVEKLYPTRHLAKFGVPDPISFLVVFNVTPL